MFFNDQWDKIFKIDPLSKFLNTVEDLDDLQKFIEDNRSIYEDYWSKDDLNTIQQFKRSE